MVWAGQCMRPACDIFLMRWVNTWSLPVISSSHQYIFMHIWKRKANKEHKDTIGKHLLYSFTNLVVTWQRFFFLRSRIHPKFIQVHPKWFCFEAHLRNLLRAKDRRVVRRGPRGRRPWKEAPSMMRSWRGVALKPEGSCETYHVWTTWVTSSLVAFEIASGKTFSYAQRNTRHPPSPTSPVTPSPSTI
jgi:hypothetical protein